MSAVLLVLVNFFLILVSILIFASPFYVVYKRRQGKLSDSRGINREIENFFQSPQANWLVFFWAFGEALFWFVIPEFLLLLIVFMRVRRKRELLLFDIYGTIAGTILAFIINLPVNIIEKIPYIQPAMVHQAEIWYQKYGLFALAYQPFSGVPYKVFAFLAPNYHLFIIFFIVAAVFVRVARYYIFYAIFSSIYPVLHKYVYRNYVRLLLIVIFIFSLMLLKVFAAYGPQYKIISESHKSSVLLRRS
jgi:hypothetical protein